MICVCSIILQRHNAQSFLLQLACLCHSLLRDVVFQQLTTVLFCAALSKQPSLEQREVPTNKVR